MSRKGHMEEIRNLAAQGLTRREISGKLGVTVNAISCCAHINKFKLTHEPRNPGRKTVDALKLLAELGESPIGAARKSGRCLTYVYQLAKRHGIKFRHARWGESKEPGT